MIEFIPSTHTYLVEGVIVQSVTQILQKELFSDMYDNVPTRILESAKEFGNNVHEAIETDMTDNLSFSEMIAYEQWQRLKRKHNIVPLEHEKVVHYGTQYIGRFDMLAKVDDKLTIIDVKTTYKVFDEYLSWQLTLYKLAYEKMFGVEIEELKCVWLPKKDIGELIAIQPKSPQDIERLGIVL